MHSFLQALNEGVLTSYGYQTPLLPPTVRYIEQRLDKTVVVVEQPPQVRRVLWVNDGENPGISHDEYVERSLAFPFVVLLLSFDGAELDGRQQLYYRRAPLSSLEDPLLQPNLLNVTPDRDSGACWLCLGKIGPAASWAERIAGAVESFWASGFNHDFDVPRGSGFTLLHGLDPRIATASAWEDASRQDSLFPLGIDWPDAGLCLGDAIGFAYAGEQPAPGLSSLDQVGDILYRVPQA